MDLLLQFQQYIKTEKLFHPKDRLLIAVSGGVDSVVLCEMCKRLKYNFAIAHCNFQLRGEESNEDEKFVQQLAGKYEVDFFVQQFATENFATANKLSVQVAARELRYEWFDELIKTHRFNYLLTAHHADDNIETILMNFFKGSGINGLKGILPKHDNIVRPLLFIKKEALKTYAEINALVFREDSSNNSDKYTRNYFRNQLIPGLEKVFPQVKENLLNNAERFREINLLYSLAVESVKKKLINKEGNEIQLPVLKLLNTAALTTVLYEIIKDYGFTPQQTDEVIKLLHATSGKYIQSPSHRILRNRKWLVISALQDRSAKHFLIEANDNEILFEQGKILLRETHKDKKIDSDPNTAQLNASLIHFPLLLRKWKQGDYFYPLGMDKKKKLSRFFIDQKLSLNEKENTWVIESDKKIIWVVGKRIDDRFKVTVKTKAVLKLILVPE